MMYHLINFIQISTVCRSNRQITASWENGNSTWTLNWGKKWQYSQLRTIHFTYCSTHGVLVSIVRNLQCIFC